MLNYSRLPIPNGPVTPYRLSGLASHAMCCSCIGWACTYEGKRCPQCSRLGEQSKRCRPDFQPRLPGEKLNRGDFPGSKYVHYCGVGGGLAMVFRWACNGLIRAWKLHSFDLWQVHECRRLSRCRRWWWCHRSWRTPQLHWEIPAEAVKHWLHEGAVQTLLRWRFRARIHQSQSVWRIHRASRVLWFVYVCVKLHNMNDWWPSSSSTCKHPKPTLQKVVISGLL